MIGSPPPRLTALDSFRGLTVAGMIIVNTQGSDEHVWWPLDHAAWNGFTPTDLVFPAFLCAMGMALGLAFPRHIDAPASMKIVRRTALLILIGWVWQMLARPGIGTFRVYGVLPRLGLCYGLTAVVAIATARRDAEDRSHCSVAAIGIAATSGASAREGERVRREALSSQRYLKRTPTPAITRCRAVCPS